MELYKELREFISEQNWIFAKTYAKSWPHEYIVQEQVNKKLFIKLANYIDKYGYVDYFYETKQIYLAYDNLIYWHMDNIINRCKIEDTYHFKKLHGKLP